MDQQKFSEYVKQLDPADFETLGREIAKSLPNAVRLLEGIAETFVKNECSDLRDIKHARMSTIGFAVNTRLIHCIDGLRSLVSGAVKGNHKLSYEEAQLTASVPDSLSKREPQMT